MTQPKDLTGKTFLVTGANSGIGYVASLAFARRGAQVILLCRNPERGQAAVESIRQESGNDAIRLYLADFSSLVSVSAAAKQILVEHPSIDVLCNNAGGSNGKRIITDEGFETTLVTNHLSGFLLTQVLLPSLMAAGEQGQSRVVFTSSYGHTHSPIDFDDLNLGKKYSTLRAYGRSKLMNLLTAKELFRRYGEHGIVSSSFHPGAVRTPIWRKGGSMAGALGIILYPFMISIEKGADTFIWLASSNDEASVNANGNYFYKCRKTKTARFATDDVAVRLWNESAALVAPYI